MSFKRIVVIDNGAGTIKFGLAGEATPRLVSPNLTFKPKGEVRYTTGDALLTRETILALTLRRPFDKGYLVNPELQREIWAKLLKTHLDVGFEHCGLVLTEPLFNFESAHAELLKVVFEGLGFGSVIMKSSPELALLYAASLEPISLSSRAQTGLVVDAGFSFCHVVPICNGMVMKGGIQRIDFGGKAMTNYFKELISFRSLHIMDETYLAETIKDALCFVSLDIQNDLKNSRQKAWESPFYREFVLPDGVTNLRGFVRESAAVEDEMEAREKEQVVSVHTERFMVPEVLFHPTDIGLKQAGLAEAIITAVENVPSCFQALLYSNLVVTGGVSSCPGFIARLRAELRPLIPDLFDLRVREMDDPVCAAWKGGSLLGHSTAYQSHCLTMKEYHHHRQHMK